MRNWHWSPSGLRDSLLESIGDGGCLLGLSMIGFGVFGGGWGRGVLGDAEGKFCFLKTRSCCGIFH